MRLIILAALALAGCAIDDYKLANQQCRASPDVAAWDNCIRAYNVRMDDRKAREAQEAAYRRSRDDAFDDAAAAGIIANGFHHQPRCTNIGGIVACQ